VWAKDKLQDPDLSAEIASNSKEVLIIKPVFSSRNELTFDQGVE
jgi:hypothetical protein